MSLINCPLLTKSMSTSITKIPEGTSLPTHEGRSQTKLLPEKGGDLLTARFSSGKHSSQVEIIVGDIPSILQPEEEVVRIAEGVGLNPKADFKAAQGHPWATAGRVLTFHLINTLLSLGYCIINGWSFFFRVYCLLLELLQ